MDGSPDVGCYGTIYWGKSAQDSVMLTGPESSVGSELDFKERKGSLLSFEGPIHYLQTADEVADWCRDVKVGVRFDCAARHMVCIIYFP